MVIFKTSLIPLARVLTVHSFFISKSQPYLESERSDFCWRPLKNEIRRVYSLSWLETSINLFWRAKILSATLKKKCEPPYLKTCHSLAGEGRVSLSRQTVSHSQFGMKIIKHWVKFRKSFCEHVYKSNGSKLHCCIEWSKFKCISSVLSRSPKAPHDQTNHQKCSLGLLFTSSTSYTISTPDLQTTTFANRNRFLWLWTLASYTDLRLHMHERPDGVERFGSGTR